MQRSGALSSSSSVTVVSALCLGFALSAPGRGEAQVIEVGSDGATAIYDRPTVFSAEGAAPIQPARRQAPLKPAATAASPQALSSAADASELSPELVEAVAWRESRLRAGVVSRAGAIGEMQLMPGTARDLGVNPYDSAQNYRGGADYLRRMMTRYDGDLVRALAAYNAGPGAVDRYKGVPPFKETKAYVAAIMDRLSGRVSLGGDQGLGR